jgi:hypothetical protein
VLAVGTVREASERAALLTAVRELGRDGGEFTLERLQALMRVEDHFQALLLYGQLDFLRGPPGVLEAQRDFALNVQRIFLEAANGFQRFLRNRASWARTRDAVDVMRQVTGLAMHAIHCAVKWGYFLEESARGAPWKQMHALYALAEADGYAEAPFVLHSSQPEYTATVRSLYLRALLLGLLNSGNLSRVQIEIADGWLASWCMDYALERSRPPNPPFVGVDLASDSGMRLGHQEMHGEGIRYLRAGALRSQIQDVQSDLRHGRLQAACGAGGTFPIEEHAALLAIVERLHESLVEGGEGRVAKRTALDNREVDVAIGIERVLRKAREIPAARGNGRPAVVEMKMIEVSQEGLSVLAADPLIAEATVEAPAADPEVERWRVQDLSLRGFGLLLDRAASEAVPLNAAVALRNQETGGWIVGTVVRKQPIRGRGEVLVGVEVLAYRPIPIDLAREGSDSVAALFLPGPDAGGRRDSILLPLGEFHAGSGFSIAMGGSRYRVRLNRIIRKGADWINARFEIESKA